MDATGLGEPQSFERVLSSMCTEPHPLARRAAERFLATNPGDPETYRTVAELETEVVERLGDLVGLDSPAGYVATGGTEANLQSVRAARNLAATDSPNVVAPASAHFSFSKAADVLGVELRLVDLGDDFRADPTAMRAAADDDTVLVVGVAGTTEYGRVDPIPELGAVARDAGARFHVDAAWGGFLLPFADRAWNFDDAPVDTMTVDPHKHGMAAIPSGGFLAREGETLDALTVGTPYLESGTQASLTGTRSGAGVASAAAVLRELWPEGYRAEYERATGLAEWFASELDARGYDAIPPALPLVSADVSERVFEALRAEGWRISRTAADELRVVCMPHVDKGMLRSFLDDLDDAESKA